MTAQAVDHVSTLTEGCGAARLSGFVGEQSCPEGKRRTHHQHAHRNELYQDLIHTLNYTTSTEALHKARPLNSSTTVAPMSS
jgi:hypothetical protein